ncbi:hypothetical protein GCM10027403_14930 [Arthrobacter tecti]
MSDTLTTDFYVRNSPIVQRAARAEHKNSTLFDVEDIEQAIWELFIRDWKNVKDADAAMISFLAKRQARTWCQDERTEHMYFTGGVMYSGEMVSKMLAKSVWTELGPHLIVQGDVDINGALDVITASRRRALSRKYGHKQALSSAEATAASRGLRDVTDWLNQRARLQRTNLDVAADEI